MSLRCCCLGYVPPPTVGHAKVFFDHIRKYKTSQDLVLYSDHDWPDTLRLKGSPEMFKNATFDDGKPNKFAIANAAFFTGLRIAWQKGYSHVLILEADCRVLGDNWDEPIWEEYFNLGKPCIAAGTLATYNPCNWSPLATKRWQELLRRNTRKNFPVATYGWVGAGQKDKTLVFPNGALAIYDMAWMTQLSPTSHGFFDLYNVLPWATKVTAWDFQIGIKIWEKFQEDSYEVVGFLDTVFSGYGDLTSTVEERRAMLTSGKVRAIHQEKGSWVPE